MNRLTPWTAARSLPCNPAHLPIKSVLQEDVLCDCNPNRAQTPRKRFDPLLILASNRMAMISSGRWCFFDKVPSTSKSVQEHNCKLD
jgi:hypothetical protein